MIITTETSLCFPELLLHKDILDQKCDWIIYVFSVYTTFEEAYDISNTDDVQGKVLHAFGLVFAFPH